MKVVTAALALASVLSGCASAPASPESSGPSVASPVASIAGIPEGSSWSKTLTEADVKKFNVGLSLKKMEWAPDRTLTTIFKFNGGAWTQFANYNGGPQQPGDGGSYNYDPVGNLVLSSTSGDTLRFAYHVEQDRLTLKMLGVPAKSSGDLAVVRMMTEGEYGRATP